MTRQTVGQPCGASDGGTDMWRVTQWDRHVTRHTVGQTCDASHSGTAM